LPGEFLGPETMNGKPARKETGEKRALNQAASGRAFRQNKTLQREVGSLDWNTGDEKIV